MKKLFIFVFLIGFSSVMLSQEQEDSQNSSKVLFSINSGLTYSGIRGNEVAEENKYDFNYIGGIGIEFPLKNKRFSILTGLNFENKSFKNNVEVVDFSNPDPVVYGVRNAKVKVTLKYLILPVETRIYIDKKNKFFINSGPFLGTFLSYSTKVDGDKVEDKYDLFKSFDFGWSLGVGTKLKISDKNNLIIQLKDNLGLVNISKVPLYNNGTVKTNSINLSLAYEFKF